MAFTVYLLDPKNISQPILVGNVKGETGREVALNACELIEQSYEPAALHGWGFEAIEFTGRKRQMSGIFRDKGRG